jgi:hypothetical protein
MGRKTNLSFLVTGDRGAEGFRVKNATVNVVLIAKFLVL